MQLPRQLQRNINIWIVEGDLISLHWLTIKRRIVFKFAQLVHKSLGLISFVFTRNVILCTLWTKSSVISTPHQHKIWAKKLLVAALRLYNKLPCNIRTLDNIDLFKSRLKTHLFSMSNMEFEKIYRE